MTYLTHRLDNPKHTLDMLGRHLAALILGGLIMATPHAADLSPSQERSLVSSLEAIAEVTSVVDTPPPLTSDDTIRDHQRSLKKADSALRRAERSLSRLPQDHSDIADGLDQIEALRQRIDDQQAHIVRAKSDLAAAEAQAQDTHLALLNSPDTQANVQHMEALADQLLEAALAFDNQEHRYTAGFYKIPDQAKLSSVAYTLAHHGELLEQAELLLEAYEPLSSSREGMRLLRSPTSELRRHSETFRQGLPEFVTNLLPSQQRAADELIEGVEEQITIFRNANKERDTSALLQLDASLSRFDDLRNRLSVHEAIAVALEFDDLDNIQSLRRQALTVAEEAGEEIAGWQEEQSGREADALAAMQAEQARRATERARQAELDLIAWKERRARIDAEREAQHQRNLEIRRVVR